MPFYRQTIGGHFYKDYKNGNSKRVSEKEYLKNVRRVKGGAASVVQRVMKKLPLLGPSSQNSPPPSRTIPVQNPPITPPTVSPSSSSLNQPIQSPTSPLESSETTTKSSETTKESSQEKPLKSQQQLPPQLPPPELSPQSPLPKETRPVPINPIPNQTIIKNVKPNGTVINKAVSPQKYTCKCSCKKIGNNNKNKTTIA